MEHVQYIECKNCGKIHYAVSHNKAKTLIKSSILVEDFRERKIEECSNCGSKNFTKVSEEYVENNSNGDSIHPVLYEEQRTTNQS